MSLWDVQRDTRDNRIIAIRPAGFKGWGRLDGEKPLAIEQEEIDPLDYPTLNAVACDKGGDGIAKPAEVLAKEQAVAAIPDDEIVAEVRERGLPTMIDDAIAEGKG